MGNTILIKHGALVDGKIPANALQPYELGYCDDDGLLYIGQLKDGICEAISINPALEKAQGTLGLENGGTGVSVDTVENLKAELRIVSSDGDTMTGTLIVPNFYIKTTNGTQPALRMTVGQNDKAIIYCRTNSDTGEGGFVFRGYNEDSTEYKDLQLKYSTNMTIPILNGGTGATTAEQALINLGANNATNLTEGTLSSDRLPTIPVSKGGTGLATLTSGSVLIGNGTSAISLRAITNNTAKDTAGWTSDIGTNLITLNTLAYWNGRYAGTNSNLAYCNKGAFGNIITREYRKGSVTANSSGWTQVTFSSAMSGVPMVYITPNSSVAGVIAGKVTQVTASGFKITVGGSAVTSDITFAYLAIY